MIEQGLDGGQTLVLTSGAATYSRAEAMLVITAQTALTVTLAGAGGNTVALGAVPAYTWLRIATKAVSGATGTIAVFR